MIAAVQSEITRDLQEKPKQILTANSINELREVNGKFDSHWAVLKGYYQAGDHGNGLFIWDESCEYDDNCGTVIAPGHTKQGRWLRLHDGVLRAAWFGVSRNRSGLENLLALNQSIKSCAEGGCVMLTENNVEIAGTIEGKSGVTLRGQYQNGQQLERYSSEIIYTGPEGKEFIRLDDKQAGLGMTFIGLNIDGRKCSSVFSMATVRGRWLDSVVRGGDVGIYLGSKRDSEWNGEHRISGCSIEGQRKYGIQVEGKTVFDGIIQSNVIYNYGRCGIYFGASSQVQGWVMAGNHIYPGLVKTASNGDAKRTIEIHANGANYSITSNYLEGGLFCKCTNREGVPLQVVNNRITLENAESAVGIDIEVGSWKKGQLLITNNIISKNRGSMKLKGKGIRITKGVNAHISGIVAFNIVGESFVDKYDITKADGLEVVE
jgi:hypothetical protein